MKPFEDICKEDPELFPLSKYRHEADGRLTDLGLLTLRDFYDKANQNCLDGTVPESIRNIYEVAQNLLVYHYFEHGFLQASDLYASMAVEATLRDYCKDEIFKHCQKKIRPNRPFPMAGFHRVCQIFLEKVELPLNQEEYDVLKDYLEALRQIRNYMAHPKNHTPLWITYSQLPDVSRFINCVYSNRIKLFLEERLTVKHRIESEQKENLKMTRVEQSRIALKSPFYWKYPVLMRPDELMFPPA